MGFWFLVVSFGDGGWGQGFNWWIFVGEVFEESLEGKDIDCDFNDIFERFLVETEFGNTFRFNLRGWVKLDRFDLKQEGVVVLEGRKVRGRLEFRVINVIQILFYSFFGEGLNRRLDTRGG